MQIALAYIPCKDNDEAKSLAKLAIEEKLAACANILPNIQSVYSWEGNIEEASECLLLLKHKKSDFPLLRKLICDKHSYETPCVTQIDLHNTNKSYLDWVSSFIDSEK
jgi:periplasmic divalent cation tolerance protein